MTYFTSDTHFCHNNIIKYCNRPFINTEEMDNIMIDNWNSVVKEGDLVYHLGDFGLFGNCPSQALEVFNKLNGDIFLIKGNHDSPGNLLYIKKHLYMMRNNECFFLENKQIYLILNHYQEVPNKWSHIIHKKEKFFVLHGHTHHTQYIKHNKFINVGVDVWNFTPVSLDQINKLIEGD